MATKEELTKFATEYKEAKDNFLYYFKPEYDKAYKLFESYTGDRAKQLEQDTNGEVWQSNVFMPHIFSYVKQYLQKTVGVSPQFQLEGKHSEALHEVIDLLWELRMSEDQIDYFLQCFIFGWTIGKDFLKKEPVRRVEKQVRLVDKIKRLFRNNTVANHVFWPDFDPVDIYNFYRHVRMKKLTDPLPVFQRYVLSLDELKAQYPDVAESTWAEFVDKDGNPKAGFGDVTDYAYVRKEVLLETRKHIRYTTESSTPLTTGQSGNPGTEPKSSDVLFEAVERWMDDRLIVFIPGVGQDGVLEIKDTANPNDYAEKPFRKVSFFPRPFTFEGMGLPKLLIHLQELVNSDVNHIEDAVTVSINGLIVAAPVALPGYDQRNSIVVRPNGILWTSDPSSVQFHRFDGLDQSNFVQIDRIKEMMRSVAGIDEYSSLTPGDKQTATVASFMREATIEGVKLFLFMLRQSYEGHFYHFIRMIQQHWTKRSVVPRRVLDVLDDFSDVDFPVTDEDWLDSKTGEHRLFPGGYEISVEQASTLASSTELRKQKDLELWAQVKDMPDTFVDPDTGNTMSIKKFKILMKIIEDYGWEKDQYVAESKAPAAPAQGAANKGPSVSMNYKDTPPDVKRQIEAAAGLSPSAESIPTPAMPAGASLPASAAGSDLGGALRQ